MDLLADRGVLMSREELEAELGLRSEEQVEALRRRLRAMERDGQLVLNRRGGYGLVEKMDLKAGRVIAHPDGFGFLVPDEGGDDIFLHGRQMSALFHGDRALVRIAGEDRRGRPEGALVEVLERNTAEVVGRYLDEGGVGVVVPDDKRMRRDIIIPRGENHGAENGQIVVVALIEQPTKRTPPLGRVREVMGDHMAPGMEIDIAIRAHSLPQQWPEAVEAQIAGLAEEVLEEAKEGRVDLRSTPLVTIDGEDARDFDDAVYCKRTKTGWKLLVAIADVSHYVEPKSPLDEEAHNRATSVYFPERVIPMLPEVLSNGLCSINPQVDRLCMVCEMTIDRGGNMTRSRFYEAVMHSHARLTYNQVWAMIGEEQDQELRERFKDVLPHVEELHLLYKQLRILRTARGAIDFDTTETRIVFGEARKIERIVPLVRNDAHKLIEECMILANVAAAKFLEKNKIPGLYRVHQGPKEEKIADLREFLKELGLELGANGEEGKPSPMDYAQMLGQVERRPDAHLIQTVMLRSLSQAVYSPDNRGHFGLAHDQYAHFTSPIRRYPDLLTHRAIRHIIRGGKPATFRYSHGDLVTIGEHCSANERRADEATREATNWLKCEYMMDKVGERFPGIITAVTGFGIFVELKDIYVEGLVHVTSLPNDYFHFDQAHHRLVGERTGRMFRLGDEVEVQVTRVNLDDRKVDFDLVSGERSVERPARADRRSSRKERRKPDREAATPMTPEVEVPHEADVVPNEDVVPETDAVPEVEAAPAAPADPTSAPSHDEGDGTARKRRRKDKRRRRGRRGEARPGEVRSEGGIELEFRQPLTPEEEAELQRREAALRLREEAMAEDEAWPADDASPAVVADGAPRDDGGKSKRRRRRRPRRRGRKGGEAALAVDADGQAAAEDTTAPVAAPEPSSPPSPDSSSTPKPPESQVAAPRVVESRPAEPQPVREAAETSSAETPTMATPVVDERPVVKKKTATKKKAAAKKSVAKKKVAAAAAPKKKVATKKKAAVKKSVTEAAPKKTAAAKKKTAVKKAVAEVAPKKAATKKKAAVEKASVAAEAPQEAVTKKKVATKKKAATKKSAVKAAPATAAPKKKATTKKKVAAKKKSATKKKAVATKKA
ncbi:hypothetical protein JCM17961_23460 [Endothiovibrio diazotrophicus]